jgi:hypothetical protein
MPRSNRPRGRRFRDEPDEPDEPLGLDRIMAGLRRTEAKRSGLWNVQRVSGASSVKVYLCPSCRLDVLPGQPHIVAWRADGVMGDHADLADRRHWHAHCWRMEP